jgi:hypothetical protein
MCQPSHELVTDKHHEPRGDSRPRLSGGATLRYFFVGGKIPSSLRSTRQPGRLSPRGLWRFSTWFVALLHEWGARAYIKSRLHQVALVVTAGRQMRSRQH